MDLYDKWEEMDKGGKCRYTSPHNVIDAFSRAIYELIDEGDIQTRFHRCQRNNQLLRAMLRSVGLETVIMDEIHSSIIMYFLYQNDTFQFEDFYYYMKERGFVLYPGKLTEVDTFRIGNIGEINENDIQTLCNEIEAYMGVAVK